MAEPKPAAPRLVFRVPASALVGVLFLVACSSAVALAAPWLALVYLIPVGLAVWLLRTRTEVDAQRLVIRRMLTRRELPWSAVASLRVAERKWVRAVRTDGREIVLPTVRTTHLPALALISGGRLPDPTKGRIEPTPDAPAEADDAGNGPASEHTGGPDNGTDNGTADNAATSPA